MLDLIKITLVFVPALLLLRKGWGIGTVLLLVSLLLGIAYLFTPLNFLRAVLKASLSPETLLLLAIFLLIAFLEQLMRLSGSITQIGEALKSLIPSRRLGLIVMPAIWGMIPTPGGALFSAPYLKELDPQNKIPPEQQTFLNYWYRHIWEYIMPIYPSVILAGALLSISYREVFLLQYPYTLWAILAGLVGFKGLGKKLPVLKKAETPVRAFFILFKEIAPILLILLLTLVLKLNLSLSLLLVIMGMLLWLKPDLKKLKNILLKTFSLEIITLVLGVMIFKEVLEVGGGLKGLSDFFLIQKLSPLWIFTLLPLLVGFLTGAQPATIGITYPILSSLNLKEGMPAFPLAFVAGFCGVLLTPVHLCLSLSVEYYRANLLKVYPYLVCSVILLLAFAVYLFYSPSQ